MTEALPTVALLAAGMLLVGAGPRNGDVAGYLWQVTAGAPWDRAVHAGYVALCTPVVLLLGADRGPLALDLVSLAACGMAVAVVSRRSVWAGWAVAAVLLPIAVFGEVDPVWVAALAVASEVGPAAGAAWVAVAVAVSPAALLGLPWLVVARPQGARAAVVAALATVGLLTVASGGAWWVGERGVLSADLHSLGRVPVTWASHLPWALIVGLFAQAASVRSPAARALREAVALAPLGLLPADVPGWALAGVAVALRCGPLPAPRAAIAAQAVVGLGMVLVDRSVVVRENEALVRSAALLDPRTDGVVAPFSTGARLSWVVTGDPYGLRWHPEGRFLRDQRRTWCAGGGPLRTFRLQDGRLVPLPAATEVCP